MVQFLKQKIRFPDSRQEVQKHHPGPDYLFHGNYRMILRDFKLGVEMGYGTNVIEFTPEKTGNFKYTCWMGMINGKIKVVE